MILVSEQNSLHVCCYAFFQPFYAQTFVTMCQRRYFNHTFDRRHYSNRTIACGLCFIWQPTFFRNSAGCSRHSIYVSSIHYYYALTIRLNHHHQTEVPSLKDFSKILTLSLISVITQQFIILAIS